jgi:hypothetical protein
MQVVKHKLTRLLVHLNRQTAAAAAAAAGDSGDDEQRRREAMQHC